MLKRTWTALILGLGVALAPWGMELEASPDSLAMKVVRTDGEVIGVAYAEPDAPGSSTMTEWFVVPKGLTFPLREPEFYSIPLLDAFKDPATRLSEMKGMFKGDVDCYELKSTIEDLPETTLVEKAAADAVRKFIVEGPPVGHMLWIDGGSVNMTDSDGTFATGRIARLGPLIVEAWCLKKNQPFPPKSVYCAEWGQSLQPADPPCPPDGRVVVVYSMYEKLQKLEQAPLAITPPRLLEQVGLQPSGYRSTSETPAARSKTKIVAAPDLAMDFRTPGGDLIGVAHATRSIGGSTPALTEYVVVRKNEKFPLRRSAICIEPTPGLYTDPETRLVDMAIRFEGNPVDCYKLDTHMHEISGTKKALFGFASEVLEQAVAAAIADGKRNKWIDGGMINLRQGGKTAAQAYIVKQANLIVEFWFVADGVDFPFDKNTCGDWTDTIVIPEPENLPVDEPTLFVLSTAYRKIGK